jgi:hypothetical protein
MATVPKVPTVPAENEKTCERATLDGAPTDVRDLEERAAILEYDGGFSRFAAEALAAAELGFASA